MPWCGKGAQGVAALIGLGFELHTISCTTYRGLGTLNLVNLTINPRPSRPKTLNPKPCPHPRLRHTLKSSCTRALDVVVGASDEFRDLHSRGHEACT